MVLDSSVKSSLGKQVCPGLEDNSVGWNHLLEDSVLTLLVKMNQILSFPFFGSYSVFKKKIRNVGKQFLFP